MMPRLAVVVFAITTSCVVLADVVLIALPRTAALPEVYGLRGMGALTGAFSVRLRGDVDLDSVRADLIGVVHDTIHPAHASVWLRATRR